MTNQSDWRRHSPGTSLKQFALNPAQPTKAGNQARKRHNTGASVFHGFVQTFRLVFVCKVLLFFHAYIFTEKVLARGARKAHAACSSAVWAEIHVWFNSLKSETKLVSWVKTEEFIHSTSNTQNAQDPWKAASLRITHLKFILQIQPGGRGKIIKVKKIYHDLKSWMEWNQKYFILNLKKLDLVTGKAVSLWSF